MVILEGIMAITMDDEQAKEIVNRASTTAAPKLEAISVRLAEKHHIDKVKLSQTDTQRIGLFLIAMQEEILALGIRIGLQMAQDIMDHAKEDPLAP